MVKLTYDPDADALYVELRDAPIAVSRDLGPGVVADLDDAGDIIGIEVLRARRRIDNSALLDDASVPVGARERAD